MGAVVGIDLGTTNTVVAAIRDGRPVALPDESGSTLIPSIVSFLPSGAVLVGNAAKERRSQDSRNTIYSVKRLIGRTWDSAEVQKALTRFPFEMREGPGRATFVLARAETYTLPEISAFVLRKAKSIAELELGEPVDRAVITVPANFNDLQRAATKVAGRVAGLEVLRILNEPTAAALAFGHTRGNRERIAVFDFGGGTFDLTLLLLTDDVFEVLATAGDTFLGGDDIDAAIVERMMRGLEPSSSVNPRANAETFERLREAAEQVKLNLSDAAETRLFLADHEIASRSSIDFAMTRDELDAIVDPIVGRTFKVCHDALTMAKLSPKDIDHVLLVGGSTRIPLVKRRVEEYFGKRARADLDPHEVVALGAAQQAMALTQLRATASGIPVAPPPRAQLASSSTEAAEVPNKLRKQTDPGVGDGDAVAAARVSVAPPEVPLSAPTPTTQNFGSRDRRTTGIGLGPSDADLPAVAVAPVAPQRNALETTTAPPSTMSGLGPHRGRVSTQQGPVGARPPTEPKPAPLIIRREPVGDFSREASDRATRVPGVKPDLTATLASAIVQPDPPSPSTDAPRTSPQFVPGIDAAIASQDLPVAKYPAQLRRPATPVDSVTELEGPKTDPQFRDAQGPIASTPDVPTPRTDPLFGTALQARTAHKETAAPSTNPIFAGAARRREPQPVPSTGKTEEPSEALSLGRAAGETIPDEVGAWEQAAYDVGADIGLPIVSGPPRSIADRSIADLRSHTEVSAESAQQVPPQRIGAKGKTVDLLADLPLVVSESAEARAERGPAQRPPNPQPVRSGLDPAPAAAHNAPTHPALPRQQPGPAATRLGLQAPEAPQRFGLPDPSQPDPNLGDSVPHAQTYTSSAYADDDDDMTADEPTMIRRPAQSSVDLSEARGALPTGPFDNLPELSTSNQGLPDLPAQDHTADLPAMTADLASSPAQPRRSGRPSSLNEEEIRARYGNLPLIVGGRRVGASASDLAGEPAPRTTTRTTAARPVERTTHAPIEFDPRGDDPATEAPGSLGPDPRSIPQPVMSHRDHGKAASIGPTAALTEPAANPSTAARDPRPIAPGARRPNSAAIANALPPLPSPPSALPIPSIEPEELDPSEIDFGPVISPPRKPDPQDRSALAAGQFEDSIAAKPRLHSSRPTAKQSAIEELELPIPDLPPLQPVATPNRPIYHAPTVPTRAAASSNDSPQAGAALRSPERAPERTLAQPKPQIVASAPVPTTTELHKGFNLDATMPLGATALPTGPWQPPASKQQVTEPATFVHAATRNIEVPPLLASLPPSAASRAALLIDVTPLSLCVETVGGYVDVLVARNTPVPCERTRDFITAHDNQQTVVVRVAQGESKLFHENVLLGEVQLTGIPAAPRGQSRIAVTFGIDSDGILHVRALEMGSGQSALVDLRLAGAPSPPEIAQMMARHAAKGQA